MHRLSQADLLSLQPPLGQHPPMPSPVWAGLRRRQLCGRALALATAGLCAGPAALAARHAASAAALATGLDTGLDTGLQTAGQAAAAPTAGPLAPLLAREWPTDADPAGFLVSEKFDGVRALWDGQRLRFRSGAVIAAPAWFTARLPAQPLDGELWAGRGQFEALVGTVRHQQPDDSAWHAVQYQVFELPGAAGPFAQRAQALQALCRQLGWPALLAVAQAPVASRAALQQRLDAVLAAGGEGLVLHRADAPVASGRGPWLYKHKPLHDMEGQVIAHLPGQGRLAGQLGALQVRTAQGLALAVGTGLSDADRAHPPAVGQWITFTHRGLTAAGVPRFASYLRRAGGV